MYKKNEGKKGDKPLQENVFVFLGFSATGIHN